MDKPKILSGDELVARGTTKIDGSLPEIGLKDVIPNGSWLEQKQIQSALEARKHLIEVERIEKCGALSHAEWREDLMLAEVTRKTGGHWQFLGHNVGKHLYLKPEEALYLIEVNCLQLKHNDVTVSLQQAYSLLLRSKINILKYKVYASLSRMGYKVFRHDEKQYERKIKLSNSSQEIDKSNDKGEEIFNEEESVEVAPKMEIDENTTNELLESKNTIAECNSVLEEAVSSSEYSEAHKIEKNEVLVTMETDSENVMNGENKKDTCREDNSEKSKIKSDDTNIMETESVKVISSEDDCIIEDVFTAPTQTEITGTSSCSAQNNNYNSISHKSKLQILQNRKLKPCNSKDVQKHFEIVPELFQKQIVTVKVPEEKYVPENVVLNNKTYVLNIESIKTKTNDRPPSDSRTYSIPEEVNGAHVRRVRDSAQGHVNNWSMPCSPNAQFSGQNHNFRMFNFWRPRTNMNYFQLNLLFQRPFFPSMNFAPRFHLFPRPPPLIGQFSNLPNFNSNGENGHVPNNRKRMRDNAKQYHLQAIKRLATRLKHLLGLGPMQAQNIVSLQRLVQTYNTRYKMRLSLTEDLDIIEQENIVETIELDDEEESVRKKPRTETVSQKYEDNLKRIKQLAIKLKDLESKNKSNARHRRALSNLVKRFNKSYKADVCINSNHDVFDRRYINLDSSSDSDCIVEDAPPTPSGKKLRNPFNILKRLSEKHNSSIPKPTTSKEAKAEEDAICWESKKYSQLTVKTFDNKYWLPNENDFGRAEIPPKTNMYNYLMDTKRDEYLFEFLKTHQHNFDNWLDIKTSFLRSVAKTTALVQSEIIAKNNSELNSIIGPEDCTDMPSILSKLSIIPSYMEVAEETSLCIDFDVYNRNVKNFRKTDLPKPHFRVICLNESSTFPTGCDVAALHAKYDDNVVILFASVSLGSISYLQINPTVLPIYVPSNDFT